MNVVYYILIAIALIIAVVFSLLVLVTGKGDAMNGGGSVRTTFKGKASFDDIMSKWTLYIGASFMFIILVLDVVAKRLDSTPVIDRSVSVEQSSPATNVPAANLPASGAPAANAPTTSAPAANVPATDVAPATNVPSPTGTAPGTTSLVPPTSNAPLDSTPATAPSSNAPTEPSVVPSVPGSSSAGSNASETNVGGATNAAPPTGNR